MRIDVLQAFILEDTGPEDEGLIGIESASKPTLFLPLIGQQTSEIEAMRSIAEGIGEQTHRKVKLASFVRIHDRP